MKCCLQRGPVFQEPGDVRAHQPLQSSRHRVHCASRPTKNQHWVCVLTTGTKAPKVFQPGRTRISRGGPPRASSPLVSGGSGGSQDWGPADPDAPPSGRRRSSAPGESRAESPSSL